MAILKHFLVWAFIALILLTAHTSAYAGRPNEDSGIEKEPLTGQPNKNALEVEMLRLRIEAGIPAPTYERPRYIEAPAMASCTPGVKY